VTIHCAACYRTIGLTSAFYRDNRSHTELCIACGLSLIRERVGLEYVPAFRGVRA
jgi:hypothetical protein